ncbi:thiol-disulfide isomerase/thioredoxin [Peptoniphilus olsenii]|uniref:Thiol-disulfide isomerase/thioredoxin n=1 Tax=Peptoniphilus olsenii TaxID=411570 RepID=A0ABV2JBQ7_9FIRM
MKEIKSYEELTQKINGEDLFLLYATMPYCPVCHSDLPKIIKLAAESKIDLYKINLYEVPKAQGQLSLMSAPCVIIFFKGREWHRQARIINFKILKSKITKLKDNINSSSYL